MKLPSSLRVKQILIVLLHRLAVGESPTPAPRPALGYVCRSWLQLSGGRHAAAQSRPTKGMIIETFWLPLAPDRLKVGLHNIRVWA